MMFPALLPKTFEVVIGLELFLWFEGDVFILDALWVIDTFPAYSDKIPLFSAVFLYLVDVC